MIYLFYGSDIEKARSKAFDWVAKARAKEPNLAYARLAREELTDAALEDAAGSGGLFVKRLLVLIDDPYQTTKTAASEEGDEPEMKTSVLDEHLDALAASDNAIIILAPKLTAVKAKKLESVAKMSYKFDETTRSVATRGFNSALVNALGARSREKLWLEIERSLAAGDAPEMLHGLLHWKVRDLMEKGSAKWTPQEARTLSLDLIELLQASRRSGLALPLALQRWALSI